MAAEDLDAATQRLAYALARGSDEALDLIDLANRLASQQALVPVRVDNLDTAVLSLLHSAQARKRASDARSAAAQLTELSDELGPGSSFSVEEFGARMADRTKRIVLLAQSGDTHAAAMATNEALAWVGDESLSDEPLDVLRLEVRGDLLWAAADAFGNNDIFSHAMQATAAALTRSADFPQTSRLEIQDHLALKLGERALILADAGSHPKHHLAQARTALSWLSDAGRNGPSGLNLRLRWAIASGDDNYAMEALRSADAAGLTHALDLPPYRRAAVELLSSWPTAETWLRELGPFAAPLYAEARGVTLAEAYVWLGEPPPAVGRDGDTWPPRALTIGRIVLADTDMDLDALTRDHHLHTAAAVRAVPTASLRSYLDESSSADSRVTPWVAVGAQAASSGDDIHHQVAAMLAYFDRHRTPTEASFTCAAILAGVVTTLLDEPDAFASYAHHLLLFDHDVALEKALRGVPATEKTTMSDQSGIFISYRHRASDTGFMAGRLYERLSATFGDNHVFAGLAVAALGVDVIEATEDALTQSAAMLVLIGPGWDPDGAAGSEILAGLSRGLRVIPVLVGTTDMPEARDLPAEMASLARRQPLPLRHERFASDVARLVDALSTFLPRHDSSPAGDATSTDNEFGMAVSAFVAADIDLDVLVDGEPTLRVDHSGGFDYTATTIVVRPNSVITFRAPGLSIERRASQIVDGTEKKLQVRVGTDTRANIPITDEQRRLAMGAPDDVPDLINVLTHGGDRSARAWAATRLGAIGDRRAIAPLLAIVDGVLPDQDQFTEWVQSQAALALAELGDPAARPAIQRALDQLPNRDHYAYLFEAAIRDLSASP